MKSKARWAVYGICMLVVGGPGIAHNLSGRSHLHGDELTEEHYIGPDRKAFSGDESFFAHLDSPAYKAGSDSKDIGPLMPMSAQDVLLIIDDMRFTRGELQVLKSFASAYVEYAPVPGQWKGGFQSGRREKR